eukprot:CAMPEP_0173273298 /NCGR_PEP_ID=MMETSP1143-20121109/1824_1 /TAXON_ID=483371 /ORGANISM="non described non described, Strain CCMP2298" /LENGTH=119 /DNA_ID=CAMNT_0014210017 /DNA_START=56 /DNA_END=411 /DNA_ORIENTATION=+
MGAAEEAALLHAVGSEPIKRTAERALKTASAAVAGLISACHTLIGKYTKQMDDIPKYGITDPRWQRGYRERLRCQARIQLQEDKIQKARGQIKNLPQKVSFERIPMPREGEISANQILP